MLDTDYKNDMKPIGRNLHVKT